LIKKHIATATFLLLTTTLSAGWFDSLSEIVKESTQEPTQTSLSMSDMNGALKEALNIGVKYATKNLGAKDGYLKNPLVKIELSKSMQKSADVVKKLGGQKYVDDLVLALNNAATEAAPKTAEIFANTISKMSIEDAKKILAGSNKAATDYFRVNSTEKLQATISPIIQKSMDNNSVAKYYTALNSFYKKNSSVLNNEYIKSAASMFGYADIVSDSKNEDLNSYVTKKSIDGLMLMIEKKEQDIRANPLMQSNDLVKKVFSVFE